MNNVIKLHKRVYTIGHSNRSLEEFIKILKFHKINVLVDVRRFPTSRIAPHFKRENLENKLPTHNIKYIWLGDLLGGYRSGGYKEYMDSEEFNRGLKKLIEIITNSKGYVALMCSERLWFKCHRRFIANKLVEKGFEVIHIIDKERIQKHKLR